MPNLPTDNDLLPDDMLCEIFDHLTPRQVLAISTANRSCYRCAMKWLETVGDLTINQNTFTLTKRLAHHVSSSDFDMPLPFFDLSFFDPILAKCPNIESITLTKHTPLNASFLIDLINRCANFNFLDLTFAYRYQTSTYDLSFTDEEWNQLLQLLQHRSVSISLLIDIPNVEHLEQLLKADAIRVKKFHLTIRSESVLKLLPSIAAETFFSVDLTYYNETIDRQIGVLIAERVNQLDILINNFDLLKASYYFQLTNLTVRESIPVQPNLQLEFSQLKSLTLIHVQLALFRSIIAGRKLRQLVQLSMTILSGFNENNLKMLFKLTPNVTRFSLDVERNVRLETGEQMLRTLIRSFDELKLVESLSLKFWLSQLYKNIGQLNELLDWLSKKMNRLKRLSLDLNFVLPASDQLTQRLAGGLERFNRLKPTVGVDVTLNSIFEPPNRFRQPVYQPSLETFENRVWPYNFRVLCKQDAPRPDTLPTN